MVEVEAPAAGDLEGAELRTLLCIPGFTCSCGILCTASVAFVSDSAVDEPSFSAATSRRIFESLVAAVAIRGFVGSLEGAGAGEDGVETLTAGLLFVAFVANFGGSFCSFAEAFLPAAAVDFGRVALSSGGAGSRESIILRGRPLFRGTIVASISKMFLDR